MLLSKEKSSYYNGNRIYEYIQNGPYDKQYFWAAKNLWILVYGNKDDCEPRLLLVVSAGKDVDKINIKEANALKVMHDLTSHHKDLPIAMLKYDPRVKPLKEVVFITSPKSHKARKIPMCMLPDIFKDEYGLHVADTAPEKDINDASSSSYHDWQRKNLGGDIIATDIDLIRFQEQPDKLQLIELKRSNIKLEDWDPFVNDFGNFKLLSHLLPEGEELTIVYNRYVKKNHGRRDDISTVKIYTYEAKGNKCSFTGYQDIKSFVKNSSVYRQKRY